MVTDITIVLINGIEEIIDNLTIKKYKYFKVKISFHLLAYTHAHSIQKVLRW